MGSKAGGIILPLVALAAPYALPAMGIAGGSLGTLSGLGKLSIGLAGASAINSISGAMANAENQKAALAIQADRQRVQLLNDRLAITQKEAETQKNLRKALAAQTVAFNARGIDPSTGSPLALQERSHGEAGDILGRLATQREFVNLGGQLGAASLANQRSAIGDKLTATIFDSLIGFGKGTVGVLADKDYRIKSKSQGTG